MATKKVESKKVEAEVPEVFDPKKLTVEQQELVVEEYLGYHPNYFIYEGTKIRFNRGRYESQERNRQAKEGGDRKWFNGWKAKEYKW